MTTASLFRTKCSREASQQLASYGLTKDSYHKADCGPKHCSQDRNTASRMTGRQRFESRRGTDCSLAGPVCCGFGIRGGGGPERLVERIWGVSKTYLAYKPLHLSISTDGPWNFTFPLGHTSQTGSANRRWRLFPREVAWGSWWNKFISIRTDLTVDCSPTNQRAKGEDLREIQVDVHCSV
jgi:hypothetical protein